MIKGEGVSDESTVPAAEARVELPTYLDILADAAARTVNTRFSADHFKWMNAIRDGQLAAQVEHPYFLTEVYFEEFREGFYWSDEVYSFLNIMGRAGAIEVGSPRFKVRIFDNEAKADFLRHVNPLVEAQSEAIAHITGALDAQVGLTPLKY